MMFSRLVGKKEGIKTEMRRCYFLGRDQIIVKNRLTRVWFGLMVNSGGASMKGKQLVGKGGKSEEKYGIM